MGSFVTALGKLMDCMSKEATRDVAWIHEPMLLLFWKGREMMKNVICTRKRARCALMDVMVCGQQIELRIELPRPWDEAEGEKVGLREENRWTHPLEVARSQNNEQICLLWRQEQPGVQRNKKTAWDNT
jgi:hypothetical protein